MSFLVDRAIDAAGLWPVVAARRARTLGEAHLAQLRCADLLAVGALADRLRAEEVGDEVRIYTDASGASIPGNGGADEGRLVVLPGEGSDLTGLELLREVALARIMGLAHRNVRVNFTACGMELAQVAVGFGANELAGQIASKRGLPFADGELLGVGKRSRLVAAHLVKQSELSGFLQRAGRTPCFVQDGTSPASPERGQHPEVT